MSRRSDQPRRAHYRFDGEGGGKAWFRHERARRRGRAAKAAKRQAHDAWLQARIPGKPSAAAGGYEPAVVVGRMILREGSRSFARQMLDADAPETGWWAREPRPAFAAWRLISPDDELVCRMLFWHSKAGKPFGIGQDAPGARWWLVPTDPAEESPTHWTLKKQAPRLNLTAPAEAKPAREARKKRDGE